MDDATLQALHLIFNYSYYGILVFTKQKLNEVTEEDPATLDHPTPPSQQLLKGDSHLKPVQQNTKVNFLKEIFMNGIDFTPPQSHAKQSYLPCTHFHYLD